MSNVLGKCVQEIRVAINMSQAELAPCLGVFSDLLPDMERGTVPFRDADVAAIAAATGISPYTWAACYHQDVNSLPERAREPAKALIKLWGQQIQEHARQERERRAAAGDKTRPGVISDGQSDD